jgi:hypothetical protein
VSLGVIAQRYSDAQLVQLRADLRIAARLLLDIYLFKKRKSADGRGTFDRSEAGT